MLRALRIEADARRGVNGGDRSELYGGRRIDSSENGHTYRFIARAPRKNTHVGEAVHVVIDTREAAGVISAIDDLARVEIALDVDLGLTVPFATLVQDNSYLIEALRDRMRAARRGGMPFNWALADALFAPSARTSARFLSELGDAADSSLNPEQSLAVGSMLMPGVRVIYGPPGTGKTLTLASGVHAARRRERRVFLLAHTNVAVDNLLERVLRGPCGAQWPAAEGHVVRVGEISSETLQADFGSQVAYEAVVRRRREPIERELQRLGAKIAHLRAIVGSEDNGANLRIAARTDLDRLCAEAAITEREYDRVPAAVLDDAILIATTIHRAYLPGNLRGQADLVVVDEASMVPLPMAVYAAGLARETVVYAGDPKQLGVITQARDPAVRRWVSPSVFQVPAIRKLQPTLLRTQYRMHPEIADLLNHFSYRAGTLITPPFIATRTPPLLRAIESGVTFIDTCSLQPSAVVPRGTHTRVNTAHSRFLAHLLDAVIDPNAIISTAVITPYRGQARQIRRDLSHRLRSLVHVDTVHRFQGDERELVVLDIADSAGAPLSRFMRARTHCEDGARLLTVGLSRAQHALVVIANSEFLLRTAPGDAIVRRLLQYLVRNTAVLTPAAFPRTIPEFHPSDTAAAERGRRSA